MQTKDWPVVIEARKAAAKQLEYYDEMMGRYNAQRLHDQMLNLYLAFNPTHVCEQCKLKT